MKSLDRRLTEIVDLLEDFIEGRLGVDTAIERWPNIDDEDNDLIKEAWHQLYHFKIDADVVARDLQYADAQRKRLVARIEELRKIQKRFS